MSSTSSDSTTPVDPPLDRLVSTLHQQAPSINESVLRAAILQIAGAPDQSSSELGEFPGGIALTVVADTRINIEQFLSAVRDLHPEHTSAINATDASTSGIFASVLGPDTNTDPSLGPLVDPDTALTTISNISSTNAVDNISYSETLDAGTHTTTKAGLDNTFDSNRSILFTAEPVHGRFDEFETFYEQVGAAGNLSIKTDLLLTASPTTPIQISDSPFSLEDATAHLEHSRSISPTIPADTQVHLTEQARSLTELIEQRSESTPSMSRIQQALQRLSIATARINHTGTVTTDHVDTSVELYKNDASISPSAGTATNDPETGEFDSDMGQTEQFKTQTKRVKNIKGIVNELSKDVDNGAEIEEVIELAKSAGISREDATEQIEKLKGNAVLYEPKSGFLRTT